MDPSLIIAATADDDSTDLFIASLSTRYFYFDSDTLALSDGAAVPSIADAYGNGVTASQATGAKRPTYRASAYNGKPAMQWPGGAIGLSTAAFGVSTYTLVASVLQSAAGYVFVQGVSGATDSSYCFGSNNDSIYCNRSSVVSGWNNGINWLADSARHVVAITFDGTHAGHTLWVDGVQRSQTSVSAGNPGAGVSNTAWSLGADQAQGTPMTGYIRRIGLWPLLSSAALAAVINKFRRDAGV